MLLSAVGERLRCIEEDEMRTNPCGIPLVLAAALLLLVVAPHAGAAKGYNQGSLDGEYAFTMVEITVTSDTPSVTIYCNGYGRIVFDGHGNGELVDGDGLCSNGDVPVYPSLFTYTVSADGEVALTEVGGGTTHCQLADKGSTLLCDGTNGPPERALWMATAVKQ